MAFAASKRKRIKGRLKPFEQLKLTSLIDMFTIILVFLLKSYSAVEFNVPASKDLHLPTSVSQKLPVDTVVVTVAKNAVLVDGAVAARVTGEFEVEGVDAAEPSVPLVTTVLKAKFSQFSRQAQGRKETFRGRSRCRRTGTSPISCSNGSSKAPATPASPPSNSWPSRRSERKKLRRKTVIIGNCWAFVVEAMHWRRGSGSRADRRPRTPQEVEQWP
ncbi:MAG: biopolymer transporter ExbD [Deltaproteobacteria bacterium]|nr:biopolymer transporter ExbD [Deltaproteobacteria bacterium]